MKSDWRKTNPVMGDLVSYQLADNPWPAMVLRSSPTGLCLRVFTRGSDLHREGVLFSPVPKAGCWTPLPDPQEKERHDL